MEQPNQLNRLIVLSHTIAHSFLAKKGASRVLTSVYGMNVADLAYDCIADLFQKDRDGNYIQLQAYFNGLPITTIREEELLAYLRRLVFSKVNQGIYRLYSEVDPSLAKILRNIKIAITTLKNFTEIERFGEPCIYPCLCDTLENYPVLGHEDLMGRFAPQTIGREKIPELLAKLSVFIREQDEYCRILPFVSVGLLFRSIYTQRQDSPVMVADADAQMMDHDTKSIINDACSNIRKLHEAEYVGRKNISAEMFGNYVHVLSEALCEKYIAKDGFDFSLYESLKKLSPGLSVEEYKTTHRNKIEYLLKMVNKEVIKQLKVQGQIPYQKR
jgi:hypothetical protein